MFKVGDKVRVRNNLVVKRYIINGLYYFTCNDMLNYMNKIVTLTCNNYCYNGCFRIAEDNGDHYWHPIWLEPLNTSNINIF